MMPIAGNTARGRKAASARANRPPWRRRDILEACRRAQPIEPQLLVLPERSHIDSLIRMQCAGPIKILGLELERNSTLQFGEVLDLVCFVRDPAKPIGAGVVVRHRMPGAETPDVSQLLGGAEMIGRQIARRLGLVVYRPPGMLDGF